MARPTTIRDEDILQAAREAFLERGTAATTADIAARAGVSEGSIFKRFKTKDDLFFAAMESGAFPRAIVEGLQKRVGAGDIREQFFEIGMLLGSVFQRLIPLIMMVWASRQTLPFQGHPNPPPVVLIKGFAGYFEAEMRLGRIRRSDPEILARVFVSAVWHHAFLETLNGDVPLLPLPIETFLRGFIEVFWNGVAPTDRNP